MSKKTQSRVNGTTAQIQSDLEKDTPIVRQLKEFIENNPDLKKAAKAGIRKAQLFDIGNLSEYYNFLNQMVKLIPNDTNVNDYTNKFYWIVDHIIRSLDPDDTLSVQPDDKESWPLHPKKLEFQNWPEQPMKQEFQNWVHQFAIEWGTFLDTPESAGSLESLYTDPNYSIDDYYLPPSGFLTFNQFFARQIRPGTRPISSPDDPYVIVSPADSFCKMIKKIKGNKVKVKGKTYSVLDLLDIENIDNQLVSKNRGKDLQKMFKDGWFTHSFLNVNDYHRFATPVGGRDRRFTKNGAKRKWPKEEPNFYGVVEDIYNIHGNVYLRTYRNKDGSIGSDRDMLGWQFYQQRGLIVIDTGVKEIGHVAVLPVGMMQVSSVVLSPVQNAKLTKGQEFGFFAFGGSDIITMFEKPCKFESGSFKKAHHLLGEVLAVVKKEK